MIRLTIEIRRLGNGLLTARCVDACGGVRGTNLLKGHSCTNVEHAQDEVRRFYARKFPTFKFELDWRVIA